MYCIRLFSDLMLGARYTWTLYDRWELTLRTDGSFGKSEGTWNVSEVAQYRTNNGAWSIGYRFLDGQLKTSDSKVDLTLCGPEIRYAFRF